MQEQIKFKFLYDKKRLGTFNAITSNISKIENEFLYTNADEISNINFIGMYKKFKKKRLNVISTIIKFDKGKLNINERKGIILNTFNSNRKKFKECGTKFINKKVFEYKNVFKNYKYKKLEDYLYNYYLKKNKIGYEKIYIHPYNIDTNKAITRTKKFL